ncbi:MAG: molecular chaperone DnaJ [Sphaerobacteraceae bacterium]|nr:MAG: molecular chaperone DnaJ [Sphaerobacteraceae bacterium]
MAKQRDYYEVLGVSRSASRDEIRKSYRRLAREFHPDINKADDAEDRFKEINEAYEVLGDDEQRQVYDRFGHAGVNGQSNGGGRAQDPFGFGGGGSPFGDIFETFFGGSSRGRGRRAPSRGADLETSMEIDFEEAVFGVDREIEIQRLEECDDCGGSGARDGSEPATCPECNGAGETRRVQQTLLGQFMTAAPCNRCSGQGTVISNPCFTCQGTGRMRKNRSLVVSVPAGIDGESTLRLSGQGEQMPNGVPGNLFVRIRVRPHEFFKRDGQNILLDVPANIAQAILGTEIEVPTVDGTVMMDVPAGTQPGQQFRLRGKGVPDVRTGVRGDQIVTMRVVMPTELTSRQRELFEELAESLNEPDLRETHRRGFLDRIKDALGV